MDPPLEMDTSALLARVVEGQIIPRLMMAHKPMAAAPAFGSGAGVTTGLILDDAFTDDFADRALNADSEELLAMSRELLRRGLGAEALYFDLFAAVARRLGDRWSDDSISSTDLTISLGRLLQVVRMLRLKPFYCVPEGGPQRSALFAACPGEQHALGLAVLDDFFHRAGWRTWVEPAASAREIAETVSSQCFDLIGLSASCSISCEEQLDRLAATIVSVRRVSRNQDIAVIVSGRLFHERPELAVAVGADSPAGCKSIALVTA